MRSTEQLVSWQGDSNGSYVLLDDVVTVGCKNNYGHEVTVNYFQFSFKSVSFSIFKILKKLSCRPMLCHLTEALKTNMGWKGGASSISEEGWWGGVSEHSKSPPGGRNQNDRKNLWTITAIIGCKVAAHFQLRQFELQIQASIGKSP